MVRKHEQLVVSRLLDNIWPQFEHRMVNSANCPVRPDSRKIEIYERSKNILNVMFIIAYTLNVTKQLILLGVNMNKLSVQRKEKKSYRTVHSLVSAKQNSPIFNRPGVILQFILQSFFTSPFEMRRKIFLPKDLDQSIRNLNTNKTNGKQRPKLNRSEIRIDTLS